MISQTEIVQMDILCAVARIEQIGDLEPEDALRELLIDRLLRCDAPRLRRLLTAETLEFEAE